MELEANGGLASFFLRNERVHIEVGVAPASTGQLLDDLLGEGVVGTRAHMYNSGLHDCINVSENVLEDLLTVDFSKASALLKEGQHRLIILIEPFDVLGQRVGGEVVRVLGAQL